MTTLKAKTSRVLRLSGIWIVVAFAVMLGGVLFNSERMDREQQQQLETACRRGNVVRAYLLLRSREFQQGDTGVSRTTEIAPHLFPLIDCRTGRPMNQPDAQRYLWRLYYSGKPEL